MSGSNWILFFHVLAALWLAAGVFGSTVIRAQTKKARDFKAKAFGVRLLARSVKVFSVPGAIVSGLLGFYLVSARGYRFDSLWVALSSALWFVMLSAILFYIAPKVIQLAAAVEAALAAGEPNPQLDHLMANKLPGILSDVSALLIVILEFLMTVKPS
ncbi:MAG TPA: DUF2269 family protein [Thermoanaerobaculia bacterium]|jgi:uncharacterized membrane protein|nr:DUF2269 family protein [Thermoanaerobaculia bacterium]